MKVLVTGATGVYGRSVVERLHPAAARREPAAVLLDRRRNLLAVLLVDRGVGHFDIADHVSRHAVVLLEEKRSRQS